MATEAEAVAAGLRRGDGQLVETLVGEYGERLLRYLVFLTRSQSTAEDLFQETWLRVLERGAQYDGRRRFDAWLFAIGRHLAIDRLRRRAPLLFSELRSADDDEREPDFAADESCSPFEAVAGEERRHRLGAALAALPARYREVLLLRFEQGLSLDEIAAVVASPLPTIKSRLYRGLDLVRGRVTEARR